MSAYGAIPSRPSPSPSLLPPTSWPLAPSLSLSVHHLTAATVPPALAALLHAEFADELERGTTYPQEGPISRVSFGAYFLAADLFVGILQPAPPHDAQSSVDTVRAAREWQDCFGGAYYVKPNYPGRSSHICNAGFLVPPRRRGLGIATALARSYLHYAPRLGFKASIFNLVYVNNVASVRIWDRLGFEKIGRIPRAGRLKRPDGGEEYVDAWIVWKDFQQEDAASGNA